MESVKQSCMVYSDTPPAGVSEGVVKAVGGCSPQWSEHPVHGGWPGVLVPRDRFADAVQALRDETGFDMLVDHTAIDYPDRTPERFTVLALLMNLATQERITVRCRVPENESVPTLSHLFKSADWAERETYDMFGILFEGHPELTRIYMPQDFDGWPLRRDFPMQGHNRFRD